MQLPHAMKPQLHAQVGTGVPMNHFHCTLCQVSGFSVIEHHSTVEKYNVYVVAYREIFHAVRNQVETDIHLISLLLCHVSVF